MGSRVLAVATPVEGCSAVGSVDSDAVWDVPDKAVAAREIDVGDEGKGVRGIARMASLLSNGGALSFNFAVARTADTEPCEVVDGHESAVEEGRTGPKALDADGNTVGENEDRNAEISERAERAALVLDIKPLSAASRSTIDTGIAVKVFVTEDESTNTDAASPNVSAPWSTMVCDALRRVVKDAGSCGEGETVLVSTLVGIFSVPLNTEFISGRFECASFDVCSMLVDSRM